ncbi:SCO family protein [Dasania sp. GY-MA-18]|uniref:SCO family protein n=1 Tax=Dasania phycosphaerae TaxID=2950436 RepID=A0A9J6RI57_9GAMM|nr:MULTISPECIES: SCO family protein [Dasania]MCR8921467.1 SCO family protein [Dasania sp. GY-MA-18]MCZ0863895.1 SCO family protein [Dasania phycosphaerae]MCZ0867623.1 SCO family protein [Dasania phycosphaerae]
MLARNRLKIKLAIGLLITLVLSLLLAFGLLLKPSAAPELQSAVYLPQPKKLANFNLVDEQGAAFTPAQLKGGWLMLSVGYTYCPDICPTTLASLVKFEQQLAQDSEPEELNFAFYTLDPQRDTPQQLQQYLAYFPLAIKGLAPRPDEAAQAFEQSLGIAKEIKSQAVANPKAYSVSHSVYMYLINPQGRLQAIFKPQQSRSGVQNFDSEILYQDYKKIRAFLAGSR